MLFTSSVEGQVVNIRRRSALSFRRSKTSQASHSSESIPPTAAAGTGPTPKRLHFRTALEEAEQAALTQGMSALAMTPSQPDDIAAEEQHPAFEVDYF